MKIICRLILICCFSFLVACNQGAPPTQTVSFDEAYATLTLSSDDLIVAAEGSVAFTGLEFLGIMPAKSQVIPVAKELNAGVVNLGLVSLEATQGDLVNLVFKVTGNGSPSASVTSLDTVLESRASKNLAVSPKLNPSASNPLEGYSLKQQAQSYATQRSQLNTQSIDTSNITLEASFAKSPLGDVDGDGVAGIEDAIDTLLIVFNLYEATPTDYELYHADMTCSGTLTFDSAIDLLMKTFNLAESAVQLCPKDIELQAGVKTIILVGNLGNDDVEGVDASSELDVNVEEVSPENAQSKAFVIEATGENLGGSVQFTGTGDAPITLGVSVDPDILSIYNIDLSYAFTNPLVSSASSSGGFAQIILNETQKTISGSGAYRDLTSSVTAAHIHGPAEIGSNGGVIVPLRVTPSFSDPTFGNLTLPTTPLTDEQIADMKANLYYLNVHTTQNSSGEIRAQISDQPQVIPFSKLTLKVVADPIDYENNERAFGIYDNSSSPNYNSYCFNSDCRPGQQYINGTEVTLTVRDEGLGHFDSWSGVTCNEGQTTNNCTFTITENLEVTGTFKPRVSATMTVIDSSPFQFNVSGCTAETSPCTINLGWDGVPTSLTATIDYSSLYGIKNEYPAMFNSWSGVTCEADTAANVCNFIASADLEITATYNPAAEITMDVINPSASSFASVSAASIINTTFSYFECLPDNSPCASGQSFLLGETVTLTAQIFKDYDYTDFENPIATEYPQVFDSWSGVTCDEGANSPICTFIISEDMNITATYSELPEITMNIVNPSNFDNATVGTSSFQVYNLQCTSSEAPCASGEIFIPTETVILTAGIFTHTDYSDIENPIVTDYPQVFDSWTGVTCDEGQTSPTCTFEITEDLNVTATYKALPEITLDIVNPSNFDNANVQTSNSGGFASYGQYNYLSCNYSEAPCASGDVFIPTSTVTLTAGIFTDYDYTDPNNTIVTEYPQVFDNWSGVVCSEGQTSPTCTFEITEDTNVTATYNPLAEISLDIVNPDNFSPANVNENSRGFYCTDFEDFICQSGELYVPGQMVTLEASIYTTTDYTNPNLPPVVTEYPGMFQSWAGVTCEEGQNSPKCTFEITDDVSVVATYDLLKINGSIVNPSNFSGANIIGTSIYGSFLCYSDGSGCASGDRFFPGSTVTLSAGLYTDYSNPNQPVNYPQVFDSWSGVTCDEGQNSTECTFVITEDTNVVATYNSLAELTVNITNPSDWQSVGVNSTGNYRPEAYLTCSYYDTQPCLSGEVFIPGESVTLTASTYFDFDGNQIDDVFDSWAGVMCAEGQNSTSCTFSVTGDMSITAVYNPLFSLNTTFNNLSNAFYAIVQNIDIYAINPYYCQQDMPNDCQSGEIFLPGTTLQLEANPLEYFDSWSGVTCSEGQASQTCTFTMTTDLNVQATYVDLLDVSIDLIDNGNNVQIQLIDDFIGQTVCSNDLTYVIPCQLSDKNIQFLSGSTVVLEAQQEYDTAFNFDNWTGVTCSEGQTSPTCTFTITSDLNITAKFNPPPATIQVDIQDLSGTGGYPSVTDGSNFDCTVDDPDPSYCELVTYATSVTLYADAPIPGQAMPFWSSGPACLEGQSSTSCTFTVSPGDLLYISVFYDIAQP